MNERRLAHHARRRRETPGQTHTNLIQLGIRSFKHFCGRLFAFIYLGSCRLNCPTIEVMVSSPEAVPAPVAALKFVRINVANQSLQSLEMFAASGSLIVLFKKRYSHEFGNSKW
jgi:hypothetical protein